MGKLTLIHTFTHERERLRTLARRFLSSDADAEDALQDAFLRLWPRADRIDGKKQSSALAITTVKNLSIDKLRARRLQTTPITERNSSIEEPADDSMEQMLSDVERIIEQELTETQRRIIRLRDYEEKEYKEIALEIGLQPTAVRMQLTRARKRIREIYKERRK